MTIYDFPKRFSESRHDFSGGSSGFLDFLVTRDLPKKRNFLGGSSDFLGM
jgi:hypothetical protein